MERYIAVDNVCAWPNLTRMPSGEIAAVIFNRPYHGAGEGDVECHVSSDGGRSWGLRGVIAPHEPGTNRMNVAAGRAGDGDLVALVSGWELENGKSLRRTVPPWVCRSADDGATWTHEDGRLPLPERAENVIPFGDIIALGDGRLLVCAYSSGGNDANRWCDAWRYVSDDDGRTWRDPAPIGRGDWNETTPLALDGGRVIAAARTATDQHLDLFLSDDGGDAWRQGPVLSAPMQHPAGLLRLADGRILLSYGVRNAGFYGVAARVGSPDGETWGPPLMLVHNEGATDGGYPSTVQLDDGVLVTAWYAKACAVHHRYHMGVMRWTLDEFGA